MDEQTKPGDLTTDEKRRLFMTLDAHTEQNADIIHKVDKLETAAYGDKQLRIKGFADDIADIKVFIAALKTKSAFWAGVGATLAFLAMRAWEWIVGGKK
jgi:hypothetical protein